MHGALFVLAILLLRKSGQLFLNCVAAVFVLCLFLMVPWTGLQSVFVAFPGRTHLLFVLFESKDSDTS